MLNGANRYISVYEKNTQTNKNKTKTKTGADDFNDLGCGAACGVSGLRRSVAPDIHVGQRGDSYCAHVCVCVCCVCFVNQCWPIRKAYVSVSFTAEQLL